MEGTKTEGDDTMLDELINYKKRNVYDKKKTIQKQSYEELHIIITFAKHK